MLRGATLTGIVLSDQPWIVPNPQPISIEAGSVGTVNFRVIRSRRATSAEGALVANLSLVYVDGNQASLLDGITTFGTSAARTANVIPAPAAASHIQKVAAFMRPPPPA